ncbi:MAG: hypothetical protein HY934_05330 [Candidatus Firestonebacteria bacterium]|nr:hypothetical protein [Candidatus Firestonebacteria bacterium]
MNAGNNPKNISVIYDVYDKNDKGTVDYEGWLSESLIISDPPVSYIVEPLDGRTIRAKTYTITGVSSARESKTK